MKIELRHVSSIRKISIDSTCFSASVIVNGIEAGWAYNDGKGAGICYKEFNKEGKRLLEEAESWCKTLPALRLDYPDKSGNPVTIPMSLARYVNDLLAQYLEEKLKKKDYERRKPIQENRKVKAKK